MRALIFPILDACRGKEGVRRRGLTRRVDISWRMSITSLAACCFEGRVDIMFGVGGDREVGANGVDEVIVESSGSTDLGINIC